MDVIINEWFLMYVENLLQSKWLLNGLTVSWRQRVMIAIELWGGRYQSTKNFTELSNNKYTDCY